MTAPVVFVHGAFCGAWAFDAFRVPFERLGYSTHSPDLPAHERGADMERLAQCGVHDYTAALLKVIRGLSAPPILIGHSLGGLIVQMAAVKADCAALVLLAPSPPWGVMPTTLDEHANAFGMSMLGDYWRRPIPPDYQVARRTTLDRLTREEARRAYARFVPESGRVVFETVQWWLDHTMASSAPAHEIKCPVLAVAGGKDTVNSASTVRRIAGRFTEGQADFYEFPTMSHWLIGEPEAPEVARLCLEWLARRGLAGETPRKSRRPLDLFGAPALSE
ncbi:MAG TPA: alpha/beta hydrolase [Caulobacterales bacterium]|nr:alpha/beta hydrolase [Caulobacterales bacterium]